MIFLSKNYLFIHWTVWTAVLVLGAATFPLGSGRRRLFFLTIRGFQPFQVSHSVGTGTTLKRSAQGDDSDMTEREYEPFLTPMKDEDDDYCELVDEFGSLAMERFCEAASDEEQFRWIRLEKQADKSIHHVKTKEDVMNQIRLAAETQGKYGKANLFQRRWKHLESGTLNGFAVDGSNDSSFTVLQFNALAEGLSAGPDVTRPFAVDPVYGQSEKGTFGGFTNVANPEIVLDFKLRRWRILEVILGSNGMAPFDIIAMEEIDRFYGFFAPLLRLFGYDGIFVPKTRSPCVRMGWYSDGCSLFWKSHIFELLSKKNIEYKVGSQVLLIALLRHRPSNQIIFVAVTHLKAQQSEGNEKVRCAQVDELVSRVKEELDECTKAYKTPLIPVLVLGDFNADAPSQTTGESSAVRDLLNSNVSPNQVPCFLESAYDVDPPEEGFYTTWKTRGTTTSRRIIDYIFFGNLSCQAHLAVPDPDDLGEAKLPSLRYPSDHMAIAAKFDLKN